MRGATALPLTRLPWRLAGLLLLGLLVILYQPESAAALQRLVIPIAMAGAAWLLVQNVAAVALSAGVLALIHSTPGSGDWISGIAYPVLAGLCAVVAGGVYLQRFRQRIRATHDARWQHRSPPPTGTPSAHGTVPSDTPAPVSRDRT